MKTWQILLMVVTVVMLYILSFAFAVEHDRSAAEAWVCLDGLVYTKSHGVLIHVEGIADNVRHPRKWVECYEAQP